MKNALLLVLIALCLLLMNVSVRAYTLVSDTLQTDATWTVAGSPYAVVGTFVVPEGRTLTIEPGVSIKSGYGSEDLMHIYGTILAQGTAIQPIAFTNIWDEEYGGNLEDDFILAEGIWGSIVVKPSGSASVFSNCMFRFGGWYNNSTEVIRGSLWCEGSSPSILNCHFYQCQLGLEITHAGQPTLFDNLFTQTIGLPVSISADVTVNFSNDSFFESGLNGIGLSDTDIPGNYTLAPAQLGMEEVSYVIFRELTIPENVTLTLAPETVVKFLPFYDWSKHWISVYGTLIAEGTSDAPITFTSIDDDAWGGYTDGTSWPVDTPLTGDSWGSIYISPSSGNTSTFSYCNFRYGGLATLGSNDGAVVCDGSSPTISQCHFYKCYIGLEITNGGTPTVTDNVFERLVFPPISITLGITPNYANNTFVDNAINAIELNDTLHTGSYTLVPTSVGTLENISYIISDRLFIAEGATLTIAPGVVIKQNENLAGILRVEGTLIAQGTAEAPIVVTTLADDEYGGDTNNDGNATTPNNGDGSSISLVETGSSLSSFSYFQLRYSELLSCWNSHPTITNCHFFNNESSLHITNNAMPTVENNIFEQSAYCPIQIAYDVNCDLSNNTFLNNGITGLELLGYEYYVSHTPGDHLLQKRNVAGIQNIPFVISTEADIPTDVNLILEPGVVIKHVGPYGLLSVQGTLTAEGTAHEPIVFTSIRDDQYGGDTNNDGNAFCHKAGDWYVIRTYGTESNLSLNHCVVRFSNEGIHTGSNPLHVKNTLFTHNKVGIFAKDNCPLQVDSCIFTNNDRGIKIINSNVMVKHSEFHHNPFYDIDNQSTESVNATYNWWGANNNFDMQNLGANQNITHIYDEQDNPSKGEVDYYPPLPTAPFLNMLPATFEFDKANNEVYFYNTSAQSDTSTFTWDFGDGSASSIGFNPNHHYELGGLYEVCLSNSTINPCYDNHQYCQVVAIPGVANMAPAQTGNTTLYVGYLYGIFDANPTAVVTLTQGSNTLTADTVIYLTPTKVQVTFNLSAAPVGSYNVTYSSTTVNGTLPNALTITPNTPYQFEVLVEGPPSILPNSFYDYTMQVKNLSNQTAFGVPVYITISGDTEAQLVSAAVTDHLPTAFANLNSHFFKIFNENTQDSVWLGAFTVLSIPPNSTESIDFEIKTFSNIPFKVQPYVGQPFYPAQLIANNIENGTTSTDCGELSICQSCILEELETVPPSDCETAAFSLACVIADAMMDSNSSVNLSNTVLDLAGVVECVLPIPDVEIWVDTTAANLAASTVATMELYTPDTTAVTTAESVFPFHNRH